MMIIGPLQLKSLTCDKTAMLESKERIERRQTREITLLNGVSSLFLLPKCIPCTAWWFDST